MAKPVELKIEKLTLGGQGIGHIDGKVCFVNGAIPGEILLVDIVIDKKDYAVARCLEVTHPSRHRVEPECALFNECGGCDFQHIAYNYQSELKKAIFLETLSRIGKIKAHVEDFVHKDTWYYRNRTQLPVQFRNGLQTGYFQAGTHRVVNHKTCLINHHMINLILPVIRTRIGRSKIPIYDETNHDGNLRHVVIKIGTRTNQIFITFVTKEKILPEVLYKDFDSDIKNIAGIVQNINPKRTNRVLGEENVTLWGKDYYEEKIDGKLFRVGPSSFFQVNTVLFEKIIEEIRREIKNEIVLDLYAGVGAIGICIAQQAQSVTAIEENAAAVNDGILNAQINHIENLKFMSGRVEDLIAGLGNTDIVVLDPPRTGITADVVRKLSEMKVKKILYLSCNPATFARDARKIIEQNFKLKTITLFDMFPQTFHIESLAVFEQIQPFLFGSSPDTDTDMGTETTAD